MTKRNESLEAARKIGHISKKSVEDTVSETVQDVCRFHDYLDVIRSCNHKREVVWRTFYGTLELNYGNRLLGINIELSKEVYRKMQAIAEKYPSNNTLQNKLDEAEKYIWPNGRK